MIYILYVVLHFTVNNVNEACLALLTENREGKTYVWEIDIAKKFILTSMKLKNDEIFILT